MDTKKAQEKEIRIEDLRLTPEALQKMREQARVMTNRNLRCQMAATILGGFMACPNRNGIDSERMEKWAARSLEGADAIIEQSNVGPMKIVKNEA